MEKKDYTKPQMKVIEVKRQQLLNGSPLQLRRGGTGGATDYDSEKDDLL